MGLREASALSLSAPVSSLVSLMPWRKRAAAELDYKQQWAAGRPGIAGLGIKNTSTLFSYHHLTVGAKVWGDLRRKKVVPWGRALGWSGGEL